MFGILLSVAATVHACGRSRKHFEYLQKEK